MHTALPSASVLVALFRQLLTSVPFLFFFFCAIVSDSVMSHADLVAQKNRSYEQAVAQRIAVEEAELIRKKQDLELRYQELVALETNLRAGSSVNQESLASVNTTIQTRPLE